MRAIDEQLSAQWRARMPGGATRRKVRYWLSDTLGRWDDWSHCHGFENSLARALCHAYDMTLGWGPGALDWQPTLFNRTFWRLYYGKWCATCGGVGELPVWAKEDPKWRMRRCGACKGTGDGLSWSDLKKEKEER